MKLIFCKEYHDLVRLTMEKRHCMCKKAWGYYKEDGLYAVINKEATPVGFAKHTFVSAIRNQPEQGMGSECDTIEVE